MIKKSIISASKKLISQLLDKSNLVGSPGIEQNWGAILANSELWKNAVKFAEVGPKVIIPTSVGGHSSVTTIESLLGVALTLRGANVAFLLCDGMMPACLQVHIGKIKTVSTVTDYKLTEVACPGCFSRGNKIMEGTGLKIYRYSDFLKKKDLQDIRGIAHSISLDNLKNYNDGILNIGEHSLAGALRFFARGHLEEGEISEQVLRRYFEAALITAKVTQNMLKIFPAQKSVFHHGIYIPQGVIGDVLRGNKIEVTNWTVAYKKQCFIFSHHETYHHALINEPVSSWEKIRWTPVMEEKTMSYLKSRWNGKQDWIWFHDEPQHNFNKICEELQLDSKKPIISLLTNVFWDAQLHYKSNAFKDMLDWVLQTIAYFAGRPELQLVIRVHPAEVTGGIPSRQPIIEEIKKRFVNLPKNIFLIRPESQVSTYALCEGSNSAIIYGTKTGVELTAMGIPVIVAGEAWIRNKGMTLDADTADGYFRILDQLPLSKRLSDVIIKRGRKYAFHFFFRRFIPINFVKPSEESGVSLKIELNSLEDLLPKRDKGLDVICDGILNGSEFIYPAENDTP